MPYKCKGTCMSMKYDIIKAYLWVSPIVSFLMII